MQALAASKAERTGDTAIQRTGELKQEDKKEQIDLGLLKSVQNDIGNKWNGTLKLKDFYVSPDFLELKGKLKEFKEVARKDYEKTPNVFSSAIIYGLLLIDLGELDEAKVVWERAVKDFGSNPTPKVYKAWVDAARGDYQLAKDGWYPIIEEKLNEKGEIKLETMWLPYHFDAIRGLYLIKENLSLKEKEQIEKVLVATASIFIFDPRIAPVLISQDLQAGRIKSSAVRLSKILELYPNDSLSITLLGIAQLLNGYYDTALKLFDKSAEYNPNSPTNTLMRARALYELKKKKESLAEVDRAVELDPSLKGISKKKLLESKTYIVPADDKGLKEAKVPKG